MRFLFLLVVGLTRADGSAGPSEPKPTPSPWQQVNDLLRHIDSAQESQGALPAQVVTSYCYLLVGDKVQLETRVPGPRWEKLGEPTATSIDAAVQAVDTPERDLDSLDLFSILPCTIVKQSQSRRPVHSFDTAGLVSTISSE
jgi:hypothetical protein